MAVASLANWIIKEKGSDAARRFYETELKEPAERSDAPESLRRISLKAKSALGF
jgi:hypothetical protein